MQKKRTILSVLRGTILFTLMAFVLIVIPSADSRVHASLFMPMPITGAFRHYPDPKNQDALPDSVKVIGNGETVLLRSAVTLGYQIYECQTSKTAPGSFAWNLQAPFALLEADDNTNVVHSTGPSWLYTLDGSQIKAKVGEYNNTDRTVIPASVTLDASSIPWIRLDVTNHLGSDGLFSRVDHVQRLYTEGGKAPTEECNLKNKELHAIREVPYTAEYVFWGS